jgi:hypothetical protein
VLEEMIASAHKLHGRINERHNRYRQHSSC